MSNRLLKWVARKNIVKLVLINILVGVFIISIASCSLLYRELAGSGNVISEDRDVEGFDKVELAGIGNLIIQQGNEEYLTIEAEDNLVSNITTKVSGNKLTIGFERGIMLVPTKQLNYHLTVKDLNSISLSGAGVINCPDFNTDSLKVSISGAGSTEIAGSVGKQDIVLSGAGSYIAKDFISKECIVNIRGAGSATVNVTDSLNATITGVGSINYIGDPDVTFKRLGVGNINNITE